MKHQLNLNKPLIAALVFAVIAMLFAATLLAQPALAARAHNAIFCDGGETLCVEAWGGSGITIYSDAGSTTKFSITGASGNLFTAGLLRTGAGTTITVTAASAITPTASYQPITAAGAITDATLPTSGFLAGQRVTFVNSGSNSITILDSGTSKLAGNAALGQYDSLTVLFDGTNWIETNRSDN